MTYGDYIMVLVGGDVGVLFTYQPAHSRESPYDAVLSVWLCPIFPRLILDLTVDQEEEDWGVR